MSFSSLKGCYLTPWLDGRFLKTSGGWGGSLCGFSFKQSLLHNGEKVKGRHFEREKLNERQSPVGVSNKMVCIPLGSYKNACSSPSVEIFHPSRAVPRIFPAGVGVVFLENRDLELVMYFL